tara:strand:- start:173 stop:691 length:519 start_codon:yes stop_codon:yes gene_type:complete
MAKNIPLYGQNKDGAGLLKAGNGGYGQHAGVDLADSSDAVVLDSSAFGKTFWCLLDGAAKTITLPASVGKDDIGKQIKILQRVDLVASGVLTISTGSSNTWAANSYALGVGIDEFRPAEANNTIVITGAATNSAWGENSSLTATVVGEGEYMVEIDARALGNGSDGIAFSTV